MNKPMRRFWKRLFVVMIGFNVFMGSLAFAEENPELILEPSNSSNAVITFPDHVEVGKAAIFDASKSLLPEQYEVISYKWSFGDGGLEEGQEVIHSYDSSGGYNISLRIEVDGVVYAEESVSIFIYNQLYLFITDQISEQERIESLVAFARDQGVYVELISIAESVSEFVTEETLLAELSESLPTIAATDNILIWTRGTSGLTLLSRFNQAFPLDRPLLQNKDFIVITDHYFLPVRNIAQGIFRTIHPSRIILTRPEALWMLFDQDGIDAFVTELSKRGIEFDLVDKERQLTPFNFMSFGINYIVQKGIPTNSLLLILMLPIIATIVAFFKQVVGVTTMGVYTPSIITLSFIALDIKFGLLIFLMILLFGSFTRLFLRRYRLLYIPRMAIVLSIVSLTILAMLALAAYFNIPQLVSISIFPMLIMSTMVEKFVTIQSERGLAQAFIMFGATVFVSTVAYYVVEWSVLKTLIFGHPELLFLFLILNVVLGRWTGLRLLEYVRFREIFRYSEEE